MRHSSSDLRHEAIHGARLKRSHEAEWVRLLGVSSHEWPVRGTNTNDLAVNNAAIGPTGLRVEFADVAVPEDGFSLLSGSSLLRPLLNIPSMAVSDASRSKSALPAAGRLW
jgi:hypothetical protein